MGIEIEGAGGGSSLSAQELTAGATGTSIASNAARALTVTTITVPAATVASEGEGGNVAAIQIAALPARTVITNAYMAINTPAAGATTLTATLGRNAGGYDHYLLAADVKAAANTVYGDASGERGLELTGYALPSWTGTTAIVMFFTADPADDLATLTSMSLTVVIEHYTIP